MDNPLEQPAPEDPIDRVHAFAYDLAWGAMNGMWGTGFGVTPTAGGEWWMSLSMNLDDSHFNTYLTGKWDDVPPGSDLMQSLDYLVMDYNRSNEQRSAFLLTQKAFALLEKPPTPTEVFISYRHEESSALALLIEAHLKNRDPDISVFIDKAIQKGDEWEERIKKAIFDSSIFICLLGPEFARSTMMRKEIDWAAQSGTRLITLLHNNFSDEEVCPDILKRKQWIKVQDESAEEYEVAILKLLNALGYSTL